MPAAAEIIALAARLCQVRPQDITGSSRRRRIVRARQAAAWALRNGTKLSLVEIGEVLGRHHTTVMYALERIERESRDDPELRELLKRLQGPGLEIQLNRLDLVVDRWLQECGL